MPRECQFFGHANFAWYDLDAGKARHESVYKADPIDENIRAFAEAEARFPEALHLPASIAGWRASVYPAASGIESERGVYVFDAPAIRRRLGVVFEGAKKAWISEVGDGSLLAFRDDLGRLAVIDATRLEVAFCNASVERIDWPR